MKRFCLDSLWAQVGHACGLDEHRCAACLRPFDIPPDIAVSSSSGAGGRIGGALLCPVCLAALSPLPVSCSLCGLPLPDPVPVGLVCGTCQISPPPWHRLHVFGAHQGLLRTLLLRAKFGGDLAACRTLGRLLAEKIQRDGGSAATALVPMPLHPSRLRQRGFNQCHEIAAPVSALLHIPRRPDCAHRVLATHPQTGLPRRERLRNLTRAFAASPAVAGQHLLLLDDTLTTGTSLRRLAACLLEAGAASLDVAVVAVAVRHHQGEENG